MAQQLAAAMSGMSERQLGLRVAEIRGTDGENERRYVRKILDGEVRRPRAAYLAVFEQVLGKPSGFFKPPPRPTAAEAKAERQDLDRRLQQTELRLAEVEDALAALQADRLELGSDLLGRIEALERGSHARSGREGR